MSADELVALGFWRGVTMERRDAALARLAQVPRPRRLPWSPVDWSHLAQRMRAADEAIALDEAIKTGGGT